MANKNVARLRMGFHLSFMKVPNAIVLLPLILCLSISSMIYPG